MENHIFTENEKNTEKIQKFSTKIKQLAKNIFDLTDENTIIVTELACKEPFCPDVMTLIAFWKGTQRNEYRIYKQMRFIHEQDIQDAKHSMLNILVNKELAEKKK
jgi:hypothetical protein